MGVDGILWTGSEFFYVVNTMNTVWSAPGGGLPITQIAAMPRLSEETRCVLSPGSHGFPAGAIFCHSPDNKIYEINPDGTLSLFATLPAPALPVSDGALIFDSVGKFGFGLVAATGRSGAASPAGGTVYKIGAAGQVNVVGGYKGPGGADEAIIAPARFGLFAGDTLLTVDAGASGGRVVAMDPSGQTRTVATFPGDGPNSIAEIPTSTNVPGSPASGIYITDDLTQNVYFVSATQLVPYAGDLFVATEAMGFFWVLEPNGDSFHAIKLNNSLTKTGHGLEAAIAIP